MIKKLAGNIPCNLNILLRSENVKKMLDVWQIVIVQTTSLAIKCYRTIFTNVTGP